MAPPPSSRVRGAPPLERPASSDQVLEEMARLQEAAWAAEDRAARLTDAIEAALPHLVHAATASCRKECRWCAARTLLGAALDEK